MIRFCLRYRSRCFSLYLHLSASAQLNGTSCLQLKSLHVLDYLATHFNLKSSFQFIRASRIVSQFGSVHKCIKINESQAHG